MNHEDPPRTAAPKHHAASGPADELAGRTDAEATVRIVGQQSLADLFGVTAKTIGQWQLEGLPVAVRGGDNRPSEFDSAACIAWMVAREVGKVSGAESPRDRLFRLQADELERKAADDCAKLVPAQLVQPRWQQHVAQAGLALDRIAPRLAAALEGLDRHARLQLLQAADEDFLRRLAGWRPGLPDLEPQEPTE